MHSPRVVGASGWTAFSSLAGVGDMDGDGRRDLLGIRASTGAAMLYPGLGTGRSVRLVTSSTMTSPVKPCGLTTLPISSINRLWSQHG